MKLVKLAVLIIYIAVKVKCQNNHHDYPFPPQFQTPSSIAYTSDSGMYLPPEHHSPVPYFPLQNMNKLQYSYLPATGTKAPTNYPTPFPMIMSSSMIPNFDDDDEDEGRDKSDIKINLSSPPPSYFQSNRPHNSTKVQSRTEKKEARMIPNTVMYRQPIERADSKFPFQMSTIAAPINQTPANRRMIISAETSRSDFSDQMKAASFNGGQFIQPPPGYIAPTTEPAIPILRLSNEMDLDGSYSYEALGADQTHYVQHSRMENMGTEKEEQVVEGSYSYVGDNGQTFTVHYVADANGFRASGDHLPVAPPVPEIIQRAVQYNLAEEARRPPHLKSNWDDESKPHENGEKENNNIFSFPPPTRSLFTGKTPEAFSYSYGQGPNVQNTNLVAAASNQAPVKTVDFINDQTPQQSTVKANNAPISPQVTFLASQGAHVPSPNNNNKNLQQSISRMFTSTEKPLLPQLMNYEANVKDNDQENREKSLWRWQYGMNANNVSPYKNSISRSFGSGDDVMINFNDMGQEEYSNMIKGQLDGSDKDNQAVESAPMVQYVLPETTPPTNYYNEYTQSSPTSITHEQFNSNTPDVFQRDSASYPHQNDWYNNNFNANMQNQIQTTTELVESRKFSQGPYPQLITQKQFLPPSQTVTQSIDYEDTFYDARKVKSFDSEKIASKTENEKTYAPEPTQETFTTALNHNYYQNQMEKTLEPRVSSPEIPKLNIESNSIKFSDFIIKENENESKAIITPRLEEHVQTDPTTTTTEESMEDMLTNNIFLKNLVRHEKVGSNKPNSIIMDTKNYKKVDTYTESKPTQQLKQKTENEISFNKTPKLMYPSHSNEMKIFKSKPVEMSDVLNYVSSKNSFESSKIKPKSRPMYSNQEYMQQKREPTYMDQQSPINQGNENEEEENERYPKSRLNPQQQEELRGIIKNYKVLHRNNQMNNNQNLRPDMHNHPQKMMKLQPLSNLPPLGRAGPTVRAYLPPIYV